VDAAPPLLVLALALFGVLAILSLAALRAWRGWLDLERTRIAGGTMRSIGGGSEVGSLRERVRRLEAIASGIDG
jgi:hypothetical protein